MQSNKHSDYITHIDNEEDEKYLTSKFLDVNMRLFNTSLEYKQIILNFCKYIGDLCLTKMEGYKKPHGMSGANVGIPLNIIAITRNREKANEFVEIMINPKILERTFPMIKSLSNCGSLTLDKPIEVARFSEIYYEFYNLEGQLITRREVGFTIQHEIDHNNGILITDRVYNKVIKAYNKPPIDY